MRDILDYIPNLSYTVGMTSLLGALLIILANVFYAGSHTLVKYLSLSLPVFHMMFFRFLAGPAVLLPYFLFSKHPFRLSNWKLLGVRVICGVLAMVFYFFSLKFTDIGKATLLFNCSTIWSIFLSMKLLGDTPSWQTKWAIPVAFVGLFFVIKPENLHHFQLGDLLALVASLFNAGVVLSLKELRKDNTTESIVMANYTSSTLVVGLPFGMHWVMPSSIQWVLLCVMGLIGLAGQLLMTVGYKYTPASIAGSVSLIVVPIMGVTGWLFFDQVPDIFSIIGGILMLVALAVITRYR